MGERGAPGPQTLGISASRRPPGWSGGCSSFGLYGPPKETRSREAGCSPRTTPSTKSKTAVGLLPVNRIANQATITIRTATICALLQRAVRESEARVSRR